jgi:glucosyl-3-phosphoglycerate synthase
MTPGSAAGASATPAPPGSPPGSSGSEPPRPGDPTSEGPEPPHHVVALVPAFRRADRVGATVRGLLPLVDEVVVVDDGSGDGGATATAAAQAGASVIVLAANRGKGGALTAGVAATPRASTYLLVDADTADTAAATAPLLDRLRGGADLCIGVLPPAGGRGGFGMVRDLARWGIRRACGFEAAAPLSGQRAVRAPLLRSLELADRFGVEVGMTIDAVRAGCEVVEVPVAVDHAHTGRNVAGFSHRAAQGYDLVRALWTRLLSTRARMLLLVGSSVALVSVLAATASAAVETGTPLGAVDRVVLVATAPTLRLGDLDDQGRPQLAALAGGRGAVAAANVDVPGRNPWSTWATVGAGSKVEARPPSREPHPERPFLVQDVEKGQGRLGDALRGAGHTTSFVGASPLSPVRLAVADGGGVIDRAATSSALGTAGLINRSRFELRSGASLLAIDAGELDAAGLDDLLGALQPADGERRLILLVTPPDPEVAFGLRPFVASGPGAPAGRLVSPSTRRDGLVLLPDVAPTILRSLEVPVPPEMVGRPLRRLARPADVPGLVAADRLSRQRDDVWDPALLAVVPLHFAVYGLAWRRHRRLFPPAGADREPRRPEALPEAGAEAGATGAAAVAKAAAAVPVTAGSALPPGPSAPASDEAGWSAGVDAPAVGALASAGEGPAGGAIDTSGGPHGDVLDAHGSSGSQIDGNRAAVGAAGGEAHGLAGPASGPDRLGRALGAVALGLVAWPLTTWILRAAPGSAALGRWAVIAALAVDALVVLVALRLGRRGLAPLAIVVAATTALVTIDLGLGGPLQLSSAFGGAAHSAGRFTGLGNAAFAVYGACALVAVHCGRRRAPWMVAVLVLVALADALPSLGGDVGGAVTLAPIFALTVAALWGRLSWRAVLLAGLATAAVVGVALAVDLSRPEDARTHLARFVAGGGRSSSIGGKVAQNLGTYAAIPALALVVAIAVGFAVLLWRGRFRRVLPPGTPARIGVTAAVALSLIGNLLNDSGPIVTLLVLSVLAPALVVRSTAIEPAPQLLPPLDRPADALPLR